jgi:hypothetical protein
MQWLCRGSRLAGISLSVAILTGCSTLARDGGIGAVQSLTRERLGAGVSLPAPALDTTQPTEDVQQLLTQPLTADDAVKVALLNNPGVRATLAGLGIAHAELMQAGRLANPRFSYGNKRNSESISIDRTLLFNVMSLLTLPLTQRVAGRQLEAAQLQAASDVLGVAGDTRRAWFSAVAAQESVRYFEQVEAAANAGSELADRMGQAGNFSALAQMRERAFALDARAQLAKARLAVQLERERLARLLGLSAGDFRLPDRLPALPATPVDGRDAERVALERRLDVQIARRSTEAMAANLGLSKATRFINVLELGYTNESNTGERRQNGYEIEIDLPLFDWGDARLARAEATYMQSVHQTAAVALAARSHARQSYQTYRTAHDIARRFSDEIVPLRKRIADENLLRYNGMLIGVFELLADAREQIASVNGSIEALRDFWLADTELQLALNAAFSDGSAAPGAIATPAGRAPGSH